MFLNTLFKKLNFVKFVVKQANIKLVSEKYVCKN